MRSSVRILGKGWRWLASDPTLRLVGIYAWTFLGNIYGTMYNSILESSFFLVSFF